MFTKMTKPKKVMIGIIAAIVMILGIDLWLLLKEQITISEVIKDYAISGKNIFPVYFFGLLGGHFTVYDRRLSIFRKWTPCIIGMLVPYVAMQITTAFIYRIYPAFIFVIAFAIGVYVWGQEKNSMLK